MRDNIRSQTLASLPIQGGISNRVLTRTIITSKVLCKTLKQVLIEFRVANKSIITINGSSS